MSDHFKFMHYNYVKATSCCQIAYTFLSDGGVILHTRVSTIRHEAAGAIDYTACSDCTILVEPL